MTLYFVSKAGQENWILGLECELCGETIDPEYEDFNLSLSPINMGRSPTTGMEAMHAHCRNSRSPRVSRQKSSV